MPPGNGNGSRSVPPGQWTFLFSVLLLLLLRFPLPASRPPSFVTPSGSTDALASDTNRYLFVGPSACLSTSCISLSLFVCSAFLQSRQGRDAGPLEQQKLFSTKWNLAGERAFRHPARIVIYHDSSKQIRYTRRWRQILVRIGVSLKLAIDIFYKTFLK